MRWHAERDIAIPFLFICRSRCDLVAPAQQPTATKFYTVIKLGKRNFCRVDHASALTKIFVTRMLTRDLFALDNLLV